MRSAAVIALLFAAGAANAAPPEAFLEKHCFECHDDSVSKGGLNLLDLPADDLDRETLGAWTRAFDRVKAGEMPPKDEPRPETNELSQFLRQTGEHLTTAYGRLYREEGRTPLRRLNPTEFEHTLRDLLATPWLQIRDILPRERSLHGFDHIAEAQEFSYVQMARYLEAAEVAIDSAMRLEPWPAPSQVKIAFSEGPRMVNRGGWACMFRQPNSAQAPWRMSGKWQKNAGWYRFKVRCKTVRYEDRQVVKGAESQVAALNTAAKRFLHTFDVSPDPRDVKFTAWLNRDELLEFFCASLSDRPCPRDKDKKEGKEAKFFDWAGDGVAVEWIEIEGPFAGPTGETGAPESFRRLFGDLPVEPWTEASGFAPPEKLHVPDLTANKRGTREPRQQPPGMLMVVSPDHLADAERLLRGFVARAYRGEAPAGEFERCFGFARAAIERKACFQDVMRAAYKAVLSSPDFLYLRERPGKLENTALASRLSYFLWRTAPDAELLAANLNEDAVLRETADRLLADARSRRFAEDFCGQWLDLRKLYDTSPDRFLFPEYWGDTHLFQSAKAESEATFLAMLEHDLPALTAVKADFVMANERLAELYGLPGVKGVDLRRVALPPDSPRGGFLTQASVLKVTANGLTTSPVIRGAWVLDSILGTPPSVPPPDVGSIEPDTRGATTVREQLDKHREIESCAACHTQIDPPGFALESFDVMGSWRTRYRTSEGGEPVRKQFASKQVSYRVGPNVDASGKTADGADFANYQEFQAYLARQEEQIARNLAERLLTFATGAGITFADRAEVESILQRTKSTRYGLRSMVREIVLSPTFRQK